MMELSMDEKTVARVESNKENIKKLIKRINLLEDRLEVCEKYMNTYAVKHLRPTYVE